jgi:pimeloyl-ACP methyl ester carboxylesterase
MALQFANSTVLWYFLLMSSVLSGTHLDIRRPNGEFRIPIYQATPDCEFPDDPQDWVVFGQGIGEIGASQKRILGQISDRLNARVFGYEARLGAQIIDPWEDAAEIARSTHQRVLDTFTADQYNVIGSSLFGLTAGAILEIEPDRIRNMTLVNPATVSSHAVISDGWREQMSNLDFADRSKAVRANEKHWRRHTLALVAGFALVGLAAETAKGVTNPLRSLQAGHDLIKDVGPGIAKAYASFGVLANISSVPELVKAQEAGTNINLVVGRRDPVFRLRRIRQAVRGTALENKLTVIDSGRGQGHSNMATLSGERQIDVAAQVYKVSAENAGQA